MMLTVVIPTLDATRTLRATIASIGAMADEIVVSDGGSRDGTAELARLLGAKTVSGPKGRGGQVLRGIEAALGEWLLLLHADTRLEPGWAAVARDFMSTPAKHAAYFRFRLDSEDPRARRLERIVALRCRTLGLPYGDQGLLISREFLASVGGVRALPIMEDVDLVRRIGRRRLACLPADAVTSAERWERDGWTRRSGRNLCCLALYYAGVPVTLIQRLYR